MKKLIRATTLTSAVLLALPFSAFAESWSCRHDNDVREIHIVQETDAAVPCSVVYKKLTEGVEDQVLWTANNDASFCQEKAQAFVDKQIGWGWTCVETIADETVTEESSAVEAAPVEAETEAKIEAPAEVSPSAEASKTGEMKQ